MRSSQHEKRASAHLFIEIPRQVIIVLFFALLVVFFLHAWRESRFLSSREVLELLGLRLGAGALFAWLGVED